MIIYNITGKILDGLIKKILIDIVVIQKLKMTVVLLASPEMRF